jgi:SAM-dependent methyltransferase
MNEISNDALAGMRSAYDRYYSTGLYDQRYPRANARTLATILARAGHAKRILDFGSGDGRYTIPLLQRTAATVFAYDICDVALTTLGDRIGQGRDADRLRLVLGPTDDYSQGEPIDLALAMFGVLGHIPCRAERVATLARMRESLKGRDPGLLILSVPNAKRRFYAEQRQFHNGDAWHHVALEPGDIVYHRQADAEMIELFYHLYTPDSLRGELHDAGFEVLSMSSESVLPEAAVTGSGFQAALDGLLCPFVPPSLGYGIIVTAKSR